MNHVSDKQRTRKQLSIFIGLNEIGDYSLCLAQGFRELGFRVTNVVLERTGAWQHNNPLYDRTISHPNRLAAVANLMVEFCRVFLTHDIFIFVNGGSFTSHAALYKPLRPVAYLDLALLKRLGKQVVITTHGSDIRSPVLYMREVVSRGLYTVYTELPAERLRDEIKRFRANRISKYANVIFSQPQYAHLLKKPYEFLWLPVNLESFSYRNQPTNRPLIVHAPSARQHKGTHHVLAVIDRLREEGQQFRFRLVEGLNNMQLRSLLSEAEIVIDQFEPAIGLLSLEAMASGCVVTGGAVPGCIFPKDLPVVTTTPNTLYQNLKHLLEHPQKRRRLADRGRRYVEHYHDYRVVSRRFLRMIGQDV